MGSATKINKFFTLYLNIDAASMNSCIKKSSFWSSTLAPSHFLKANYCTTYSASWWYLNSIWMFNGKGCMFELRITFPRKGIETKFTSTLSPYKLSLWFSLLKTWAGYLFRALQAISSANISIILSSGIPNLFTVLDKKSARTNQLLI